MISNPILDTIQEKKYLMRQRMLCFKIIQNKPYNLNNLVLKTK